jgi:hypothetical protein
MKRGFDRTPAMPLKGWSGLRAGTGLCLNLILRNTASRSFRSRAGAEREFVGRPGQVLSSCGYETSFSGEGSIEKGRAGVNRRPLDVG